TLTGDLTVSSVVCSLTVLMIRIVAILYDWRLPKFQ
ncbi:MAG TPA: trimeric intracellular cation channel family protein, partial [Sulfurihydrogenibium azorense]|nr:trimeric intracellular cation channel family protein [Sulfurihydrogenibium azorense]